MAGKAEQVFETVYQALNRRRSQQGAGTLEKSVLKEILAEERISTTNWYTALARAKRKTPNLYAMVYTIFGETPPAPRSQEQEEVEAEPQEEAAAEDVSAADVLSTVVAWLERLEPAARTRVLASAKVFFEEDKAA